MKEVIEAITPGDKGTDFETYWQYAFLSSMTPAIEISQTLFKPLGDAAESVGGEFVRRELIQPTISWLGNLKTEVIYRRLLLHHAA